MTDKTQIQKKPAMDRFVLVIWALVTENYLRFAFCILEFLDLTLK
jgi:hypothetical protein